MIKKYNVELTRAQTIFISVEAKDKEEAIKKAFEIEDKYDYAGVEYDYYEVDEDAHVSLIDEEEPENV